MASRGLSAPEITGLGESNVDVYHLLRVDFSTKLYYTDAPHDIDYDDGDGVQTYISSANCPTFPNIKETLGIRPSTLSLEFSGSAANHAITLTENYKNAPIKIYRTIGGISKNQLVINGEFPADVSGWSGTYCTPTWDSGSGGRCLHGASGGSSYVSRQFTVSMAGTYNVSIQSFATGTFIFAIGDSATGFDHCSKSYSGAGAHEISCYLASGTYWFVSYELGSIDCYFDNASVTLGSVSAITLFDGFLDSFSTKEDQQKGTSVVTWKCASHWANWEAMNGRFINSESQARIGFSSDKFFEFAGVTDSISSYWGGLKGFGDITKGDLYKFNLTTGLLDDSGVPAWYQDSYDFRTLEGNFYNWENRTATASKLPVCYGSAVTQGTPIFRAVTGPDNEFLWVVYAISEGICDSLESSKIKIDGVDFDDAQFDSKIKFSFYVGSDTQTESSAEDDGSGSVCDASALRAASPEWDTNNRDGKGITYCIMRYEFDRKVFDGIPDPVFHLKGKVLADPGGGSDAHSINPAWILYDYLSNSRYGKSVPIASLKEFDTGATYSAITNYDWGTTSLIPTFSFNGMIDTSQSIKKNAEAMLFSMRGYMAWVAGDYKLVIERDDSTASVYSFDEDNMTGDFGVSESGIKSLLNLVEYEFIDPLMGYSPDVVYADSATYLAEDHGRELRTKVTNKFETNRYRAKNRAQTILKHSRENISGSLNAANADALQIECGDIIDITRPTQGWVNKKFRVHGLLVNKNGSISITDYREYSAAAFNWAVGTEYIIPSGTTLIDPFTVTPPTGLVLTTGNSAYERNTDGTIISRVKASWTPPANVITTGYDIYLKEGVGTKYLYGSYNDPALSELYITPVNEGVTYTFYISATNSLGRNSSEINDSIVAAGKTDVPDNVSTFTVTRDVTQLILRWDEIADNDVNYYSIKEGSVWSTGTNERHVRGSAIRYTAASTGNQEYMIKAVNNSGVESASEKYASASVPVSAPTGLSLTSTPTEQQSSSSGTTQTRIKIAWTATSDTNVDGYEIRYKTSGASDYIYPQRIVGRTVAQTYIEVLLDFTYQVEIRSYSLLNLNSSWVTGTRLSTGDAIIGKEYNIRGTDSIEGDYYFWHTDFTSLDFLAVGTNVTLGSNNSGISVPANSGGSDGFAYRYMYNDTQGALSWDQPRIFRTVVEITRVSGTPTEPFQIGMGFLNYQIMAYATWNGGTSKFDITAKINNGGTSATSGVIASISSGVAFEIYIETNPSDHTMTLTIDGASSATIGTSSSFPSGFWEEVIMFINGSNAGGEMTLWTTDLTFLQDI